MRNKFVFGVDVSEINSHSERVKNETYYHLAYTRRNGERAEMTFTSREKLETALVKAKAANPGHDMAEVVTPYEVTIREVTVPERLEKPMTAHERRVGMAAERESRTLGRLHHG
jgi:hypothetical protein